MLPKVARWTGAEGCDLKKPVEFEFIFKSLVWSVHGQAPYGWPAALGLTPPTAGALFADHQMPPSALGSKVVAADATNKRSPDLHHDRFQQLCSATDFSYFCSFPRLTFCIALLSLCCLLDWWSMTGSIPWGHSGPLCHALLLLWTSILHCHSPGVATVAPVSYTHLTLPTIYSV